MWRPDGREILYALGNALLRIQVSRPGTPQPVSSIGQIGWALSISRRGDRLAYSDISWDVDIWRIGLGRGGEESAAPVRLAPSTKMDVNAQFSSDGQRIAFSSNRSGPFLIWACDSDGSRPVPLTSVAGQGADAPRWSPDGKQVVFEASEGGNRDIWVVDADGRRPRPLTQHPAEDSVPSWSRDGRWIYFRSIRSGEFQVWKMPAAGGSAIQVTKGGDHGGFESPDGRLFYYAKGDLHTSLWSVPTAGGTETKVADGLESRYHLAMTNFGIFFASDKHSLSSLEFDLYRFATGRVEKAARVNKPLVRGTFVLPPGLAVSPDGRFLLFSHSEERGGDLVLVENFR